MNWSFHMETTTFNKTSTNWHEQGHNDIYIIAYLTNIYFIPQFLMVNSDQIRMHFVPTTNIKDMGNQRCKTHSSVRGGRQIL
jgi:hypothetical protein